ncbi:hypothetical protein C8R47DRAFT_336914 [Mycena vitilis]|nr:hypothetical protein C8R47DRAFT_336914 [Mycena vitilis]
MFHTLRGIYHDIRYMINLAPLPPPSTMSPVMSSTFFPITDGNRHQPLSVSAALGAFPFRVHTSAILQEMMIASGDSCENLRITKVEYFQRDVAPLHEYLVFSFADCDTRGVASFMILERWGTDFQPPDKTKSKVTEHPITLDATGISESKQPREMALVLCGRFIRESPRTCSSLQTRKQLESTESTCQRDGDGTGDRWGG